MDNIDLKSWSSAKCKEWANSSESESYKVSMRLFDDWEQWLDPKAFKYDGQEQYSMMQILISQSKGRSVVEYRRARIKHDDSVDESTIEYFQGEGTNEKEND